MTVEPTRPSSSTDHPAGCLLRLFWLLFGNVALALSAMLIVRHGVGLGATWADALFGASLLALLAARYLDIHRYAGQTSEGTPATPADFRRYAAMLLGIAAVAWAGAHAIVVLRQG